MLPNERDMLLKFKTGGQIESDKEYNLLQKAAATGLVKFGMGLKENRLVSEAALTPRGKWFLRA